MPIADPLLLNFRSRLPRRLCVLYPSVSVSRGGEGGFSLFLLPYLRPPLFLPLSALSLSLPSSSSSSSLPPSLPPACGGSHGRYLCLSVTPPLSLSPSLSPSLSGRNTMCVLTVELLFTTLRYNVPLFRSARSVFNDTLPDDERTNERTSVRACVRARVRVCGRVRTYMLRTCVCAYR